LQTAKGDEKMNEKLKRSMLIGRRQEVTKLKANGMPEEGLWIHAIFFRLDL
jgi:hypothetical protein